MPHKKKVQKIALDLQHKNKIMSIEERKKNREKYEQEIEELYKRKEELMNEYGGYGYLKNCQKIYECTRKIEELESLLQNVRTSAKEYFNNVGILLYDYSNYKQEENVNLRNVFQQNNNEKAKIYNEYTKFVNPDMYTNDLEINLNSTNYCEFCGIEMDLIHSEGVLICPQCNVEERIIIDSEKPSFRDPPPESGEFTYKRIGRLEEWITQYQGEETTDIPQEVLDRIVYEMRKEGLSKKKLVPDKVREYLKKIHMTKYYEHTTTIIQRITGKKTPRLSNEMKELIKNMFRQIQDIFEEVKPDTRINFISYSYLLYKCLELLHQDEHLKYFKLHKARIKIYEHDQIWKKICKKLDWEFMKTI